MNKRMTSYQEDLIGALKDPREASAYLNAAMEEGDRELLLLAMRNVAEAQCRGSWREIFGVKKHRSECVHECVQILKQGAENRVKDRIDRPDKSLEK